MAYESSMTQNFVGSVSLSPSRAAMIRKTYMLLSLSILAAISGAIIASTNEAILSLFTGGWVVWIVVMLLLNGIPMLAMACRHNPVIGTICLILDGFVAGVVLGPAIYIAMAISPAGLENNIVLQASLITLLIFAAVTAVIFVSGKKYSAPRGLLGGMFIAIIGAVLLSFFFPGGILGIIISAAIGIFGVLILIYATSDVIHNPAVDSPIMGALMIFAGLFNVFTAILHILLAFASSGD